METICIVEKMTLEPAYTAVSEKFLNMYFCQLINFILGMEVESCMYKYVYYNVINANKNLKLFECPLILNQFYTFYWTSWHIVQFLKWSCDM